MTLFIDTTNKESLGINTWVPSESEGPGPWEPRTIAGHEYEFPEVDFWPSTRTIVSMGKVDKKGNIEHSFLFTNSTRVNGTIDGPIDYDGRFSIPRHDNFGNLEMDVHIGTNAEQNNAFDITLTIIPRPGPYLYPLLHIGGREGTSAHAWRFNHLPDVNLQQGTIMTHSTGFWGGYRPEGSMKVDTLLDLERTVDSAGRVKYGAEWEVLEENDDGNMVLVPYAISWISLEEG